MGNYSYITYGAKETKLHKPFEILETIAIFTFFLAVVNQSGGWWYPDVIMKIALIFYAVAMLLNGIFALIKVHTATLPDDSSQYKFSYLADVPEDVRRQQIADIQAVVERAERWRNRYFYYCKTDAQMVSVFRIVWSVLIFLTFTIETLA